MRRKLQSQTTPPKRAWIMLRRHSRRLTALAAMALFSFTFVGFAEAKPSKVVRKRVTMSMMTGVASRSIQAKSNISSTHNKTADAIVQNLRG